MAIHDEMRNGQPMSTEIHKLGSRLWRHVQGDGKKVVLVTSALRGEGKSTTVAYLASALALHPGRRIMAIDMDFRNPSLNRYFNLEFERGLGSVLGGHCPVEQAIVRSGLAGEDTGLDLLLPERDGADPGILLNTPRLVQLFRTLRSKYDLILLDTPAVIPVADAATLIPHSDAVIIAVMAGVSTKHHLKRARELCLGLGATILGLVVGNVQQAAPGYLDVNYYAYAEARAGRRRTEAREPS